MIRHLVIGIIFAFAASIAQAECVADGGGQDPTGTFSYSWSWPGAPAIGIDTHAGVSFEFGYCSPFEWITGSIGLHPQQLICYVPKLGDWMGPMCREPGR